MILLSDVNKTSMDTSTLVTIQKDKNYFELVCLFESGIQQSYSYHDEDTRDADYNRILINKRRN